jgi:hypothetical protein
MFPALTATEAGELAECEAIVERGLETFIEVGTALLKIRDGRLYRQTFGTFEDYCRVRWGMSRQRAGQLIDAASVAVNVNNCCQAIPANEAQARPLARLEPEQQREAWQHAVESAPNGKPTARQVEEAAESVAPRPAITRGPLSDQRPLWAESESEDEPEDDPEIEESDSSDDEPEFLEDESESDEAESVPPHPRQQPEFRPGNYSRPVRPTPTKHPFDVVIDSLLVAVASVEAQEGPQSGGWGGIEKTLLTLPVKRRRETRQHLLHLSEKLQEWAEAIDQIGERTNGVDADT